MKDLYNVLFKRKSIRKFDDNSHLTNVELDEIKDEIKNIQPLVNDIKVAFEIVPRKETTATRGEYCLLMYSEEKPYYLLNAGYMLEQMDLILASKNIGVCWYGLAKTKKVNHENLSFVIMLNFGKCDSSDFRNSIDEFDRKSINEIWSGEFDSDIKKAVRVAPSACNTQSWFLTSTNNSIEVYRNPKVNSFIPPKQLEYFNTIDMGICLCFLEIALLNKEYNYSRVLCDEMDSNKNDLIEIAKYEIKN